MYMYIYTYICTHTLIHMCMLCACVYVFSKQDGLRGDAMMEQMLISKFTAEQVAVMSPLAFKEEADFLRKEYTKVQAARRGMPGLATATDAEIDR